jgi:raffinose/stachyose/melibiose transport system permease protein
VGDLSASVPTLGGGKRRSRRTTSHLFNHLVLLALVVFAVGPLVILVFNSLKTQQEIGKNPLGIPHHFVWSNFGDAWDVGRFAQTMGNSAQLVAMTVIGVLILGGMAAYSLAKLDLPGSSGVMLYLLVGSSLPLQLFLVPLFFLWQHLHLTNSLPGLALIYIGTNAPLAIFILRSFMVQLPRDFEDAARVDGAGELRIFTSIVVPLSWPGFLTVGLVVALSVWNEFLLATVFNTDQKLFTVVTSYYNFTTQFSRNWALTSAGALLMIFPIVAIFLLLQRRFIEGLTQGGVKG